MFAAPLPRRRALQRLALSGLGAGFGAGLAGPGCAEPVPRAAPPALASMPAADDAAGFRLVGEFEPMRAVWLGYDPGHAALTTALARTLAPHVELRLLLTEDVHRAAAAALMQRAGVPEHRVRYAIEPQAIFFIRDSAVFTRGPEGRLGVVDFKWSQYGLATWCRRRFERDEARVAACTGSAGSASDEREALDRHIARLAAAEVFSSPLFLEGGGIEVNGQGLALVSESLIQQRNPGVGKAALEAAFLALPGLRKVIWLADGLASDPHLRSTITGPYVAWGTGGHTDEFVRFADAQTVLLAWPDDADAAAHPVARLNRQRMQRNFDILSRSSDAQGRPLKVLRLPTPRSVERRIFLSAASDDRYANEWTADFFPPGERRREGQPVIQVASSSYLNFVIANGVVVVPGYEAHGTPRGVEQRVRATLEQALPGRQLVFIDALGANWVGGGPHCATLNEPGV